MVKCCNDSVCNTYSEYELADILLSSAQKLSEYSEKTNIFLNYGFGCSKSKDFLQLSSLRDGLQHQYNQVINSETPCLCPCRFQPLLEKVLDHIGVTCKSDSSTLITIDESDFPAWAVTHPLCVTLETWEACLCTVCEDVTFDINYVSSAVHSAMIQYQLVPQSPVSLDTCKINFNILSTSTNCTLTFDQYVSLINCGISHDSIVNIVDCNIPFNVISTITNCDIDFSSTSTDPSCDPSEEELVVVSQQRCLYNDDMMGWFTSGDGEGGAGVPGDDAVVTSLIVNGIEYVPVPVSLEVPSNINIINFGVYNSWLVDFINSLGIPGFVAELPTEADKNYIIANKPAGAKAHNILVITKTIGATFTLDYEFPVEYWYLRITESSSGIYQLSDYTCPVPEADCTTCEESEAFNPPTGWYLWCPVCPGQIT